MSARPEEPTGTRPGHVEPSRTMFEKLAEVLTEGSKARYEALVHEQLTPNHRIFQHTYHVLVAAQLNADAQMRLEDEIVELERQQAAAKLRIEQLESLLSAAKTRLDEIHDMAHGHSTGPTVPDGYWAIRAKAAEPLGATQVNQTAPESF